MTSGSRFAGRTVVITGGASGIGLACGELFAAQGARLVLLDHSSASIDAAVRQFSALGVDARCIQLDVTDAGALAEVAGAVTEVDVLVNSAGVVRFGGTRDTTEQDWDRVLDVNLKGTWLTTRAFTPQLERSEGPSVVNVASNMGLKGVGNQIAYSASKGGVIAMTRSMAIDLADARIRVNCVAPGHVSTPMGVSAAQHLGLDEQTITAKYPLGRVGESGEVASVIAFLASSESAFMTGAIVAVDGGYTA